MWKHVLFLLLALAWCALASLAYSQGRPIPPGVREADKLANAPIEAPIAPKRKPLDAKQLKQEADELAHLSATIPDQIGQIAQGQLPKDLGERLKRIEKLAKHLRSEIVP